MLRINLRLVLFFLTTFYSFSQDQTITLDEIWNGTFSTQRMEALHSMNNGKQYSRSILVSTRISLFYICQMKPLITVPTSKPNR